MNILKKITVLSAVIWTLSSCHNEPKKQIETVPPNVIIILTDDQGWGDLSSTGNSNIATPNIDGIAANGLKFNNFFVQPVCSPTRAELLTGIYHTRLGVYSTSEGGERMKLGVETIADVFQNSGYATAAYGKWHNGMQPPYHPNNRGFQDFYGFCSGHWGNYFSPTLEHNGELVKGNGFLADDLVTRAIDFIKANKETPFFLYLPLNTPHSPMQVPDSFYKKFANTSLKLKTSEDEDELFTKAALAMVENIDYNVGRLLDQLKKENKLENTIVVFLSDNGPNSVRYNGGLRGIKGSTDEGGVKTVCYMQWPNSISKKKTVNTIASGIDILPTLATLANIPYNTKALDGRDLSKSILKTEEIENRVLFNYWNGGTSVRTQDFRLDHENRLYNMHTDIEQQNDISDSHQQLKDSLINLKEAWFTLANLKEAKQQKVHFTLGFPEAKYTQLPARDANATGQIKRSNKWPNDSFYTNWVSEKDSIFWPVKVLEDGKFKVVLYYTCKAANIGTTLKLIAENNELENAVTESFDPPLVGMEQDKHPRKESYVKDFKALPMGQLNLEKGEYNLTLKSPKIVGKQGIDFRLLQFIKVEENNY
ncbi:N-acetylgalactosamine-6-sulfatase [Croceivirga lutea]|uniref:arylsulfatase n=1 Tax=Croceivirga lutea TaxID=1775167 RepID=UPI0016397803|nr:arylsulfatase [Croceivirga lutea]GGG48258.1 N-acetylgalactosamine-6-sulfatase [Croceivirga lutea]